MLRLALRLALPLVALVLLGSALEAGRTYSWLVAVHSRKAAPFAAFASADVPVVPVAFPEESPSAVSAPRRGCPAHLEPFQHMFAWEWLAPLAPLKPSDTQVEGNWEMASSAGQSWPFWQPQLCEVEIWLHQAKAAN